MIRFLSLLLLVVNGFAADVLQSARIYPWAGKVGIPGGIPDSSLMTIYTNFSAGASEASVNAALNSCPSNQVVQMGAGAFSFGAGDTDCIRDHGVVWRGTGTSLAPQTFVTYSSGQILIRTTYHEASSGNPNVNLFQNLTKGDTTAVLASAAPSWLIAGNPYIFDQLENTNISKLVTDSTEGSQPLRSGRGYGWEIKVTAVTSGTNLTLEFPSPGTITTADDAEVSMPEYDPSSTVPIMRFGIESIHFSWTSGSQNSLQWETPYQCWMKDTVVSNTALRGISIYGGYQCEFRRTVWRQSQDAGAGAGYGIALTHGSCFNLIEDNIFVDLHVGVQENYSSACNATIYNFFGEGLHDSAGQSPAWNAHGVISSWSLIEGNWMWTKAMSDDTHGSGGHAHTIFRNYVAGYGSTNFTPVLFDASCVNLRVWCFKHNIVGNNFGTNGYNTIYMHDFPDSDDRNADKVIYRIGYGADYDVAIAGMDLIMLLNHDSVTDSVADPGAFTIADLVDSYFHSSKPAYFGALAWKPFGADKPTATSPTNIPAGWRFVMGTEVPEAVEGSPGGAVTLGSGTITTGGGTISFQ